MLDNSLMEAPKFAELPPSEAFTERSELPKYTLPLVGGLCVILVFCFMIGLLILEPTSAEREEKKRIQAARRAADLHRIAAESWTTQPERLEN